MLQAAAVEAESRPLTPATPTRRAEGSLSAALSSAKDMRPAQQYRLKSAALRTDSAPAAPAAQSQQQQQQQPARPSPAPGGTAAIAIPKSSALPAHSTWGKASKAPSAAPTALPQPAQRESPLNALADRARLALFAAGSAAQMPSTSPASKDGSTTDSSLKAPSRDQSFVFVGAQGGSQVASSPEQLPQIGQPIQPALPAPAPAGRPDKPSPAAQHASFRRWASHLDNGPSAQAEAAPAHGEFSGDDAVAARFVDALLQPAVPAAAETPPAAGMPSVADMPSAAAILGKPMPQLAPLPSPFDTEELQRHSGPVSRAAVQSAAAAAPRDSAFLGFPKQPAAQPSAEASMNGAPAAPCAPGPSGSHARSDHERHPVKDRRHSKWKNFGRGGFTCESAEPGTTQQDGEPQDSPPSRHLGGKDHSSKGRFSRCVVIAWCHVTFPLSRPCLLELMLCPQVPDAHVGRSDMWAEVAVPLHALKCGLGV